MTTIDTTGLRTRAQSTAKTGGDIHIAPGSFLALLDALDRAETERDEWRQTALDERGAALDLLEQIKVRDRRIQAVQHLVDQADTAGDWTVTCSRLQRAIDGTTPNPYRASETA